MGSDGVASCVTVDSDSFKRVLKIEAGSFERGLGRENELKSLVCKCALSFF